MRLKQGLEARNRKPFLYPRASVGSDSSSSVSGRASGSFDTLRRQKSILNMPENTFRVEFPRSKKILLNATGSQKTSTSIVEDTLLLNPLNQKQQLPNLNSNFGSIRKSLLAPYSSQEVAIGEPYMRCFDSEFRLLLQNETIILESMESEGSENQTFNESGRKRYREPWDWRGLMHVADACHSFHHCGRRSPLWDSNVGLSTRPKCCLSNLHYFTRL